jgi:hypothetical protein
MVGNNPMQQQPPSTPNWQNYTDTKVQFDVLTYLQQTGWMIKKQTFYNHCGSGKLKKSRNGLFTRTAVKKYAETWLVHGGLGATVEEDSDNLLRTKTTKEIARIDIITTREQFKHDVDLGKYVSRSDVEVELVSRAIVLDNGFEYMFQAYLSEMIALVKGDQQRGPALLEFLQTKKNDQMNIYANMGEFLVALEIDN